MKQEEGWRARCDEATASPEEIEASYPFAIEQTLGLAARTLLDVMPPSAELAAGLDELVN